MAVKVLSEHQEQATVIQWARMCVGHHPELDLLHAIPNAGQRSYRAAGWYKAEGLRPGLPDLHLPVARGGYIGLWIELKRSDLKPRRPETRGPVTENQREWHRALRKAGHRVEVCYGAEAAMRTIRDYLSLCATEQFRF